MSSTKNLAILITLAGLAGVAAWATLGGVEPSPEATGLGPGPEPLRPSGRTVPRGPVGGEVRVPIDNGDGLAAPAETGGVGTTVEEPLQVHLTPVASGLYDSSSDLPPPQSGATATLSGRFSGPRGPIPGGLVRFLDGPNAGREIICDSQGAFSTADLYPGLAIVAVDAGRGWTSEREVRLGHLSETPLNISFSDGALATVRGTVVNERGEAISGARVRLDGREAITNEDGVFDCPRVTSGTLLLVIEADGFARYRESVPVQGGTTIVEGLLKYTLVPEASLQVTLVEDLGHPGPGLLYLFPAGGQRVNTMVGQRTFPWHAVNPIEVFPRSTKEITGLPPGTIYAMLFRAGARAQPQRVNVKLVAGRTKQIELHLVPGDKLEGRVLRDGKPVHAARVRLEAPDAGHATTRLLGVRPNYNLGMVLPHLPSGIQEVKTTSAGRFTLSIWPEINNRCYLTAWSPDGKERATMVVSPSADSIELELEPIERQAGAVEFLMDGRFQGLPVELRVADEPRDPFVLPATEPLLIEDLAPGLWRVDVRWNRQYLERSVRIEVPSDGQAELSIDLPQGALEGRQVSQR